MFVIRLLEMGIHAPKSAQALLTARVQGEQPPPAPVCQLSQGQPAFQHSPEAAGGCHWSVWLLPLGRRTSSLRTWVGGRILHLTENGRDAAAKGGVSRGPCGLAAKFWHCCGTQVPSYSYRSRTAVCCPLPSPPPLLLLLPLLMGLSGCCVISRCFRWTSLKAASLMGPVCPRVHVYTDWTGPSQYPVKVILIVSTFCVPVSF